MFVFYWKIFRLEFPLCNSAKFSTSSKILVDIKNLPINAILNIREGPYKAQALKVYTILREAVINNVMKEYYRNLVYYLTFNLLFTFCL